LSYQSSKVQQHFWWKCDKLVGDTSFFVFFVQKQHETTHERSNSPCTPFFESTSLEHNLAMHILWVAFWEFFRFNNYSESFSCLLH
jgi:hypothetical protein